jgi:hypothetical protein
MDFVHLSSANRPGAEVQGMAQTKSKLDLGEEVDRIRSHDEFTLKRLNCNVHLFYEWTGTRIGRSNPQRWVDKAALRSFQPHSFPQWQSKTETI